MAEDIQFDDFIKLLNDPKKLAEKIKESPEFREAVKNSPEYQAAIKERQKKSQALKFPSLGPLHRELKNPFSQLFDDDQGSEK